MDRTAADPQIDDRFMADWVEFGMREMDAYLAKHARFSRYLHDLDGRAGDALA